MNWIYSVLLPKIVSWLIGKEIDFERVIDYVKEAEDTLKRGDEKDVWVKNQLADALGIIIPWVLNFLVEIAVAYCKKQGWIK